MCKTPLWAKQVNNMAVVPNAQDEDEVHRCAHGAMAFNYDNDSGGGLDIHKATSAVKLEAAQAKVSPKAIAFTIDEVSIPGNNMLFIASTIFRNALSSHDFRTRDLPFAEVPILKLVGMQL